jgi:two-component system copper resistance phosphate regulon response regulator CusR
MPSMWPMMANAGWDLASTQDYEVIILDLMLPGLGGADLLLKRLRRQQAKSAVLILTARDAAADKVELLESGADDYLTKPFAFAELLARIKALLRRPPPSRPHVSRIARDLELDRLTQQVRRAGERIDLASKEYALLGYLLRPHAGQVLRAGDDPGTCPG